MPWKPSGGWLENKYGFKEYLTREGSFVWSFPMSREEAHLLKDAAYRYHYYKKYRCKVEVLPEPNDQYSVIIITTSLHPVREYV